MSALDSLLDLAILWFAALGPALVYLAWVRKSERYMTEGWGALLRSFFYGAFFATIVAAIVETIIVAVGAAAYPNLPGPDFTFLKNGSPAALLFGVLVVAPLVEEALKASGVVRMGPRLRLLADGPVFGASVGLGFGFFETFLYGLGMFLAGGLALGLEIIVIRSLSSVLLHGSTTGMFGYGYAAMRLKNQRGAAGAYYLLAVLMHASFNAIASLDIIAPALGLGSGPAVTAVALGASILFAFVAIEHVGRLIAHNDVPLAPGGSQRYRPPPARSRPAPVVRR